MVRLEYLYCNLPPSQHSFNPVWSIGSVKIRQSTCPACFNSSIGDRSIADFDKYLVCKFNSIWSMEPHLLNAWAFSQTFQFSSGDLEFAWSEWWLNASFVSIQYGSLDPSGSPWMYLPPTSSIQYGAIGGFPGETAVSIICFNPVWCDWKLPFLSVVSTPSVSIPVWCIGTWWPTGTGMKLRFNSIMVRWEHAGTVPGCADIVSIPVWCDWRVKRMMNFSHRIKFQFQYVRLWSKTPCALVQSRSVSIPVCCDWSCTRIDPWKPKRFQFHMVRLGA